MTHKLGSWKLDAWNLAVATFVSGISALSVSPALSQNLVVPDDTLGAESSQVNRIDSTTDQIEGGALRDANLFHSFQEFNIDEGLSVYFDSPAGVERIFSRVTGTNPSNILGTLGVDGAASLFLLNPNGILFGPNASLDVGGSFLASTASAFSFQDGDFSARDPQNASVLEVSVPLGLQYGLQTAEATPGSSIQNAATLSTDRSLTFITDRLETTGRFLSGGDVRIIATNLEAKEGAQIYAGSIGNENGGSVVINATETVRFDGFNTAIDQPGGAFSDIAPGTNRTGGDVRITANNLEVLNGAQISASNSGSGDAGSVVVDVTEQALFDGARDSAISGAVSNIDRGADGTSGGVRITAQNLEVLNGAQLSSSNSGIGSASSVVADIAQTVTLDGINDSTQLPSGIFSSLQSEAQGSVGGIQITANNVNISNGAILSTATFEAGDAGDIAVEANETLSLGGFATANRSSGIFASAQNDSQGDAGNIQLMATDLEILDGAVISTSSFGSGRAGSMNIVATDIEVAGGAFIVADTNGPSDAGDINIAATNTVKLDAGIVQSSTNTNGRGTSGNIRVSGNDIEALNGAQLVSATRGIGDAGDIVINATETVSFDGFRRIPNGSNGVVELPTGASSRVLEGAAGTGGNIQITAGSLALTNGAKLNATTAGAGDAGNVVIAVAQTASFEGSYTSADDSTNSPSGAFSSTLQSSTGEGGDINIAAENLQLVDSAELSAISRSVQSAGNISLEIRDQLLAENGNIRTSALSASGGDIDIDAGNVLLTGDSDIETLVGSGMSDGGNIDILANSIVSFDDSDIISSSQAGRGGNIFLNTTAFFGESYRPSNEAASVQSLDNNSRVDINASGAITGTTVVPQVDFIEEELAELPDSVDNTGSLVEGSCIARARGDLSFIVSNRGSSSVRSRGGYLPLYSTGTVRGLLEEDRDNQNDPVITEPEGVFELSDGRLVMGSSCE